MMKGSKKWREKNRLRVALSMANPPQTHSTIVCPTRGMVVIRLVITVAPQKDICPQGRTYPRNAVLMDIMKINAPISHVWGRVNEW